MENTFLILQVTVERHACAAVHSPRDSAGTTTLAAGEAEGQAWEGQTLAETSGPSLKMYFLLLMAHFHQDSYAFTVPDRTQNKKRKTHHQKQPILHINDSSIHQYTIYITEYILLLLRIWALHVSLNI